LLVKLEHKLMEAEKFWDFLATNYDAGEGDPAERQDLLIIHKYLQPGDIVMEYGCGTGMLAMVLAGRVKAFHAIDISSKMVAAAERKAAAGNIHNIHFAHTTIFEARYPKESFDVVMAFNILHLLEDAQPAVKRINELLKPGGLFISSTPCLGEKKAVVNSLLSPLFIVPGKLGIIPKVNLFRISELEDMLSQANFQVVETKKFVGGLTDYLIVARKMEITR
jgi:2-polyprenyl-3-methyl-5-hydroxy-6-metoxy-1,4-benzoquinol methylase